MSEYDLTDEDRMKLTIDDQALTIERLKSRTLAKAVRTSMYDKLLADKVALGTSHARLRGALEAVSPSIADDGLPCWCLIRREPSHDAGCNEARAAIAEARKIG